jgi:transcriptional regulator with XRE-family HTH domain
MASTLGLPYPGIRFGPLLRRWRSIRRMSQLDLALSAEVSARHVSFLESERASPSRRMVLTLAESLELPLREQNLLLQAAGFAPLFRESRLDAPEMAAVRRTLELILRAHEPYRAVALTRHWDVVMANRPQAAALSALTGKTVPAFAVLDPPRPNLLRLLFSPALRSLLVNWEVVARIALGRAHREAIWSRDQELEDLAGELAEQLPAAAAASTLDDTGMAFIPVEMRSGDVTLRFLSSITTLGAPQDVSLQELRIEAYLPADDVTDRQARRESEELDRLGPLPPK